MNEIEKKIIYDSLLLRTMFFGSSQDLDNYKNDFDIENKSEEDLENFIELFENKLGNDKDLLVKYYENYNYNFLNSQELIYELLILMKFKDYYYFKDKINRYYIDEFEKIIIQDELYLMFVYYELINSLKKINEIIIDNLEEIITFSVKNNKLNSLKYLENIGGFLNNVELLIVAEKGYLEMLKYFVNKDIYIQSGDFVKDEMLALSSKNGHLEIVQFLLEIDVYFSRGNLKAKALESASNNGHYEIVELLLKGKKIFLL